MKKFFISLLAIILSVQTTCFCGYWKAEEDGYKFNFTDEKIQYSEISGEWDIIKPDKIRKTEENFENGSLFEEIFGKWGVENGVYIQGEEIASATTRAVISEWYENFSLELDVFPKSEENTLMIYFGYESEEKFNSIEINSYQSKLILNGAEETGKGSILKDNEYKIRLDIIDGCLSLYCDGVDIFKKENIGKMSGRVGIGTWNSIIGFDNFKIEEITDMGNENKLTNLSNEKSLVVFDELSGEDFTLSTQIAARRIHSGEIGVGVRLDENHDGYYIGFDKNGIYIAKQENGKKAVKARSELNLRSEKLYKLSVICDKEKIIALVDGEEVLSLRDSGFSSGKVGIFADGTRIFCTGVEFNKLNAKASEVSDEESSWKLYDIEKRGSVAEKLILKLGLLKEYEDGSFRGEKLVTNSELSGALSLISGIERSELLNAGYIRNELTEEGILSADDFVFALTRLLGLKDSNHQKAASEASVLKGVVFDGENVNRQAFAKCLYNTLLADKMSLAGFEGDKLVFEKNTNLLEEAFKIKEIEGIVEADSTAYINEKITLPEKTVLLGGLQISGMDNTKDFVGRNVRAYVRIDKLAENYAEAVLVEEYKNNITRATSEFIDGATTSKKLVWLDPVKERFDSEEIPKDAVVIHNGTTVGKASEQEWSLFTPSDGEVNLIDNDNDGEADVVVIWDYITYVVEYVNAKNKMIFDKSGKQAISLEDRKYTLTDKNADALSLESINMFDVLSVAYVKENDEVIIRKSETEPVTGAYRRDGYTIWVGNDNYSICGTGALNGARDNDRVKVYLDIYDRAAFVVRESVYEYAYLSKSVYSDDGGENVIYLKMYSFSEGAVKKEFADTVTVQFADGKTKYYKNKVKDNSFKVLYDLIKNRQELVKIRENSDGKVRDIIFPKVKMWQNYPDSTADFDIYYGWEEAETFATKHAKFLQNTFESRYRVTADTKILSLEGNPDKPERFKRVSGSELVGDNDYSILVYDVNEKFEAGAVVIYRIEDWYSRFGSVVGSVEKAANEDGEEIMKIVVYTLGEEQVLYADNKELTSDGDVVTHFENEGVKLGELVPGDVIYYLLGNDGMISGFAVLHKNKPGQQFYHRSNYGWGSTYIPNAAMTVTYCEVLKVYGDLIVADIDGAKPINENVWRNYYIYEKGRNRLKKAERTDVKPGDKIVGLWKWSNMNDMIIYR